MSGKERTIVSKADETATIPAGAIESPGPIQLAAARLRDSLRLAPVVGVLVAIWGVFGLAAPAFLTPLNLTNLVLQTVVIALLALGMTQVLIVGEIDLAMGAISAIGAAVFGQLAVYSGVEPYIALPVAILVGALLGLLQGVVVTYFSVPSFIVTLGAAFALQGVLLLILPQSTLLISLQNLGFARIASTYLDPVVSGLLLALAVALVFTTRLRHHRNSLRHELESHFARSVVVPAVVLAVLGAGAIVVLSSHRGVPLLLLIVVVIYAIVAAVMARTPFGVSMYAVGGNAEAAARAGINVARVRIVTFTVANVIGTIAGILAATRVLSVSPTSAATEVVLQAIAACIIGGVAMFGGRGRPWTVLLGALVMGSVGNGLYLLGAPEAYRLIAQGGILVAAILFDSALAKLVTARARKH